MYDTAIEVHDLHKSYAGEPVLDGVSFAIGAGEIFGIAGRNGAGKTTTVEILQGLRPRDRGRVSVLGLDPVRDRRSLRPRVGSQLQHSALLDRLRVDEALALFARLAGRGDRWRELADRWGLGPVLRRPFSALSGGQRQRLFLALALIGEPELVFLDELTQGLDPSARRETWRLIERARDGGATIVLVTHDMEEAERLCNRVAVLDGGRVVASGSPSELARGAGAVRVRFSTPDAASLEGLTRVPGVEELRFDGTIADVALDPAAVARLAGELDRRRLAPGDFTVIRPSLEEAVLPLMNGAHR